MHKRLIIPFLLIFVILRSKLKPQDDAKYYPKVSLKIAKNVMISIAMTSDKILVLIFSGIGIIFTYWFFLMKKEKEIVVPNSGDVGSIDIKVEGGYNPEVISIPYGKTTKLNFIRKDKNSCLEEVILGDFKVRKFLPLNETVTIELTPKKKGEFGYSCGMNMFHGKIIVR